MRRTPVSLSAFARNSWTRPAPRDLIFAPIPAWMVLLASVAVAVAIRISESFRQTVLYPLFGSGTGEVIGTLIGIAVALAITHPFLRRYAEQHSSTLAWYGALLAGVTAVTEALYLLASGRVWSEISARYSLADGQLWLLVLLGVALTPLVWGRWVPAQRRGTRRKQAA